MSIEDDLKTLKDKVQEISGDNKSSLAKIGDKIGTLAGIVANLSGILQLPSVLISLQSSLKQLFGGEDPIKGELDRIANLLQVTFSFEESEADLTQMQLVNDAVVRCRSALTGLLLEQPPYLPTALDRLNIDTLTELNLLESEPYWKRVFFGELEYEDYWFGRVEPPGEDIVSSRPGRSFVFDYRLTLAGYLDAIWVRTSAIVLMLASDFLVREAALAEIQSRATALENFYNRILRGFKKSRTPTFNDVVYQDIAPPGFPLPWLSSAFDPVIPSPTPRPVGVVSALDGNGIVDSYPDELFPNRTLGPFGPFASPTEEYFEFATRYALGAIRRELVFYVKIGLDRAWTTIQDLRRISGQAPEAFDKKLYWSLRDIGNVFGLIVVIPGEPSPPFSVFEIVRRLAVVGKVDNSQRFFISCRTALEAATA